MEPIMKPDEHELERLWQKAERARLLAVAVQREIVATLRDRAADPSVDRIDREDAHRRADALERALHLTANNASTRFEETVLAGYEDDVS
jgi:hypothetical protein